MNETQITDVADEALIAQTRAGDQRAFAELWRRHYRSGLRAAHQFTSIDADDLVSEAFTRIYKTVRAGGGPTGAFRPYFYTVIRNIAATWGAASHDVAVEDIDEFEDPSSLLDPSELALDRTLTARAFRSLPDRWQSVLWYTEVEGLDPHEIAPILGMSANGVAALSYRAREGLRKAWIQAHISDAAAAGECKWVISKLGDRARHSLPSKDADRLAFHLTTCARCFIISEEVEEVGSRLASVLLPISLGSVAGGTLLVSLGMDGASASAISIPPVPDLSAVSSLVGAGTGAAAGAVGLAGGFTAPVAVLGSLTLAFSLAGTAAVIAPNPAEGPPAAFSEPAVTPTPDAPGQLVTSPSATPGPSPTLSSGPSPSAIPDSVTGGEPNTVNPNPVVTVPGPGTGTSTGGGSGSDPGIQNLGGTIIDTITGGTPPQGHTAPGGLVGSDINLNLLGTATPGAHLSLQAAGQVYATTTVDSSGNFTLRVAALPGGLSSLEVVQLVDREYLKKLLPGGGVLSGLLGTVDALIDALIKPVVINSGDETVTITPVNG